MSYTNLNGKRRRSARILSRSLDTIPEALYQDILSYLIRHTTISGIFQKNYRFQFINKTFQRSFHHYLKTNPLNLYLHNLGNRGNMVDSRLPLLKLLKRYDIPIYDLFIRFYDGSKWIEVDPTIMEAMYGINFTSLRKLKLYSGGRNFDLKIIEACKELTHLAFDDHYLAALNNDQSKAEKLKTILSSNKSTLEYLEFPILNSDDGNTSFNDIIPKDLSWPNLKKININAAGNSASKSIESSTLQFLRITLYGSEGDSKLVFKCPNLQVLLIKCIGPFVDVDEIELTHRSSKPYDYHDDENDDEHGECIGTCHPSELRKIGMEVEVGSDCDIGICIFYKEWA